eukprot:3785184-Prymnesium_polylepis.1
MGCIPKLRPRSRWPLREPRASERISDHQTPKATSPVPQGTQSLDRTILPQPAVQTHARHTVKIVRCAKAATSHPIPQGSKNSQWIEQIMPQPQWFEDMRDTQ